MLAGQDDCGLGIADCGFEDKCPVVRACSQFAIRNPQSAIKRRSLQPVPPRHEFFTKETRRLLHGGENIAGLPAVARRA
jgi:hypothetical protein